MSEENSRTLCVPRASTVVKMPCAFSIVRWPMVLEPWSVTVHSVHFCRSLIVGYLENISLLLYSLLHSRNHVHVFCSWVLLQLHAMTPLPSLILVSLRRGLLASSRSKPWRPRAAVACTRYKNISIQQKKVSNISTLRSFIQFIIYG